MLHVFNKPTAGPFAYELGYGVSNATRNILIYDYGGGTIDVTVLGLSVKVLDVKATSGSASLGGEDIDVEIQEKVLSKILCQVEQEKGGEAAHEFVKNIRAEPSALAKIRAECKLA